MRLIVDRDRCHGSGSCWSQHPELVFRGPDGLCRVRTDPLDAPAGVLTALAIACPTGALALEGEDDFYDVPNVGP